MTKTIQSPVTVLNEDIKRLDANLMKPGTAYTPVTNATTRPRLVLSGPDPRPDSDYNPEQLKAGIEVEKEHSDNPAVATFITKDHLDERKDYYQIIKKEGL